MEAWKYYIVGILLMAVAVGMTEYFSDFLGMAKNVLFGLMVAITILSGVAFIIIGVGEDIPPKKTKAR